MQFLRNVYHNGVLMGHFKKNGNIMSKRGPKYTISHI